MMFIFFIVVALVLAGVHYWKLRKELHQVHTELSDALAGEWGARLELNYVRDELLNVEVDFQKLVAELDRVHNTQHRWLRVQQKLASRTMAILEEEKFRGDYDTHRARAFKEHIAELLAAYPPLPEPQDLDQL